LKIHIVQKGDTLWELSKKYGVDFEALKSANSQLSSPDMIMPGMKIRIPTSAKTVKKEMVKKEAPIKEQQVQMPIKEQKVETPYKDISPKPMPVVKEDDLMPQMDLKPEMPMPQMPQIPQMQTPPMMQAPTIEQDLYMQFNFQESESSESMHHVEPQQQPIFHQPMYQPVQMIPCYPVHPCCYGMPPVGHHGMPMYHPHGIGPMAHPGMMMPMQEDNNDCGCGGGNNYQVPQMGGMPQFDLGMSNMNMHNSQFQENMQQMGPNMTVPGMSGFQANGFPTPPGFGELRMNEDESSD